MHRTVAGGDGDGVHDDGEGNSISDNPSDVSGDHNVLAGNLIGTDQSGDKV
ncbi:MAG: hypothetical protein MUF25_20920 [Pirellulaceae bacterium]|jgi:hypothetical protein|nr:hypothetical protein [Pirellulaceae bacterium]